MTLESTTDRQIARRLTELGAWHFKTWGSAKRAGLPDRIACLHGRFVALEVKSPTARRGTTRLQRIVLERIQRAGGIAATVRSVDELDDVLRAWGAVSRAAAQPPPPPPASISPPSGIGISETDGGSR